MTASATLHAAPTGISEEEWDKSFQPPTGSVPIPSTFSMTLRGVLSLVAITTAGTSAALYAPNPHIGQPMTRTGTQLVGATDSRLTFATTLKALQIESGLTWTELGRILGVDRKTLNNWVRGLPVSSGNANAIQVLSSGLRPIMVPGNPAQSRSRILAPDPQSGISAYTALLGQLGPRRTVAKDYSPLDLLNTVYS